MRYLQRGVIGQKHTDILPVYHGILQVKVLVAVVLQGAEPRKDTLNDPAVPSRAESSAAENTVGGSGQLGVSSQNDVEALEAKMKAMDIEHAQRIDSIERGYAQRVKMIKAKHAEEMVDIREKVGRQSFPKSVQLHVVTSCPHTGGLCIVD